MFNLNDRPSHDSKLRIFAEDIECGTLCFAEDIEPGTLH